MCEEKVYTEFTSFTTGTIYLGCGECWNCTGNQTFLFTSKNYEIKKPSASHNTTQLNSLVVSNPKEGFITKPRLN